MVPNHQPAMVLPPCGYHLSWVVLGGSSDQVTHNKLLSWSWFSGHGLWYSPWNILVFLLSPLINHHIKYHWYPLKIYLPRFLTLYSIKPGFLTGRWGDWPISSWWKPEPQPQNLDGHGLPWRAPHFKVSMDFTRRRWIYLTVGRRLAWRHPFFPPWKMEENERTHKWTYSSWCIHLPIYCNIYIYIRIYIYIYMVVDQNSFIPERPFFAKKKILSRNFRKLHVYLSRGPCWPTTPLMKIRSPPAKLRQGITDHFLVAF